MDVEIAVGHGANLPHRPRGRNRGIGRGECGDSPAPWPEASDSGRDSPFPPRSFVRSGQLWDESPSNRESAAASADSTGFPIHSPLGTGI